MKQNLGYTVISLPEKIEVLFCEPGGILAFKEKLEDFEQSLKKLCKMDFHILVSDRIDGYFDMPKAAHQISELSQIAGKDFEEQKIFWWEEMKYEELLLEISRLPQVRSYVEERLYSLEEYDRKHGTGLVETLEVMLQNGGSKKQTAEKLYLHRNTMMYRVKKIEEILKCNIGDFTTLQELAFVCLVRRYLTENGKERIKN